MSDTRPPEFRNQPEPTERHATADQARQGPRSWPVLLVLIGSLILGAIYIISLLIYSEASDDEPPPAQGSLPAIHRVLEA